MSTMFRSGDTMIAGIPITFIILIALFTLIALYIYVHLDEYSN